MTKDELLQRLTDMFIDEDDSVNKLTLDVAIEAIQTEAHMGDSLVSQAYKTVAEYHQL